MTQVICWWLPNIYIELRASPKNFKFPCSFAYSASLTGYLLGISDVVYPKYNFWFLVPKFIWPTVFIISVPSNIQIFKPKTWELDRIPLFPSSSTPNASASPVGSIFVIRPLIFTISLFFPCKHARSSHHQLLLGLVFLLLFPSPLPNPIIHYSHSRVTFC